MIKFLIDRPIAVLTSIFAILLLGIVSSYLIPTSLMPEIDIPEITIQLNYENNSAREIETNIIRPLKNQLIQISNLKDIETETRDGVATVKLSFEYGTDTDLAFIETNEKVDGSLNYLPKDLERPRVIKASTTDIPIVCLTVSLREKYNDEKFLELSDFVEAVLKKRIEQLEDISMVDINGQTRKEIIVIPNQDKLLSLNITSKEIVDAIQRNNFKFNNLIVQNGIYQYNFNFSNPLKTKKDIENIYLNINGKLFKLGELSKIEIKPQNSRGLVYSNGKRSIAMNVIKQNDARVYDLNIQLEKIIKSFHKEYPHLLFETNQDQSLLLKLSIDNLKSSLLTGSILGIIIMFFFLNDLKSPLIIAVNIPVSLILSILIMYFFGMSINIISLSGLVLGVGMMIDNSIIVIDNITQKLDEGLPLHESCIKGTNEIITPLITSVLTTCSVFLPLIFLSGIAGALFYDQAMAVSIGLGSSLLVAIFVIPVLYSQINNRTFSFEKKLINKSRPKRIEEIYKNGANFFLSKKWIIYTISFVSIVIASILFQTMEYSVMPRINQNETIVSIDWNENISVKENQRRTNLLIKDIKNIKTSLLQVGEQQFLLQRENSKSQSESSIYLMAETVKKIQQIKAAIKEKINTEYPNCIFSFSNPKSVFEQVFGSDEKKLAVQVYSSKSIEVPDVNNLYDIEKNIENKSDTSIPLKSVVSIEFIHENILLYDVAYENLINELRAAFNQNFIDYLKSDEKIIPIKLNYEYESFEKIVLHLFVKNSKNELIPVKNLIRFNKFQDYKIITGNGKGEFLEYNIDEKKDIESTMENIQNSFKDSGKYNIMFSGDWFEIKQTNKELIYVMIVALLLLFFIMTAQFESFWQPLIILIEIPIDIGGSLLLLWLFGGTINIMSVIGIIVLSGIVINDSILKIHTINELRKQGLKIEEAIKEAGRIRIKSILMTSITTILGLIPVLFSDGLGVELQKPLALTIIGGMIIGTFISLYFIPVLYYSLGKRFSRES